MTNVREQNRKNTSCFDNYFASTIFPVTKDFDLFFLVLSSVTNLRGQFVWVRKVTGNYCGSCKVIFVTPKKVLKTQSFEGKDNLSS